jgi:RNA polymerase sigma-70 factor (ECF subfamily)
VAWFSRKKDLERDFMEHVFVHADGLYRYGLRLCGDEHLAADLVQDCLTRAFDAYGRLRPGTNHRAWAYTILRNGFISRQRKHKREEELPNEELVVDGAAGEPGLTLVKAADGYRHGFEDEVLAALAALSETQRTAVVLCDVEGMSYEEIAEIMACPVGTVRSRIHHARRRLRELLTDYGRDRGYGRSDEAL